MSEISGTSTITAPPARERALERAQVDLRLPDPGDAVQQQVAPPAPSRASTRATAAVCAGVSSAGGGVPPPSRAARAGGRPAPRGRPWPAAERSRAVVPPRSTRSLRGSGPSASSSSSARRRARRARDSRSRPPTSRAARARARQGEGERAGGRRAVVGRDPEAQLEHGGCDARLVREPLDQGQLALVRATRPPASTTTPRTPRPASGTCTTSPGASSRPCGRQVVAAAPAARAWSRAGRPGPCGWAAWTPQDHGVRGRRDPRAGVTRACGSSRVRRAPRRRRARVPGPRRGRCAPR